MIHQIAMEQAQVIDFSRRLQSGQVVGNLSQIPAVSTFTGQPNENVRYLVIVKFNDPLTGERRDYPVEIYSDVPILKDDVLAQAIRDAESRIVPLSPPTTPVPEGPIRVTSATIISASKRA